MSTTKFTELQSIDAVADGDWIALVDVSVGESRKATMEQVLELVGDGFATSAELDALDTRVDTAETDIDTLQTDVGNKLDSALPDGQIFVGDSGGEAQPVAMSDEATISNTGAVTLNNASVIGKVLTGYTSGSGTVSAADTILQAIQKLNGNDALRQALSTITAKGDLYAGTGSGTTAALPVGTNGYVLTADSAQATGLAWEPASGGSGPTNVASVSTTYTVDVADKEVRCDATSSGFTVTLYSGSEGDQVVIKKTDSTFNIVTIDDGGSDTTLNTQSETVTYVHDGTNWNIQTRYIPSVWTTYTPTMTGFGTPTSVEGYWMRRGQNILIRIYYVSGTPTGVEARASLPSGLTSDGSSSIVARQACGLAATGGFGATFFAPVIMIEQSVTYLTFGYAQSATGGYTKQNANTISSNTQPWSISAEVSIAGWKG